MTTLAQLLDAAQRQPEDLLGWSAVADLLEEHGDTERAEVLRLDLWLRQAPPDAPERTKRHRRLSERLASCPPPYLPGLVNSLGMEMRLVPSGTFRMGSPKNEKGRRSDEQQHEVEITRPYFLGVHAVTVAQYRAFVGDTGHKPKGNRGDTYGWEGGEQRQEGKYTWQSPGFEQGDDHPVVCVSWHDAVAFCAWLSKQEERAYRLPTDAEWERACRGGAAKHTPFHVGRALSPEQANFSPATFAPSDDRVGTMPVASFAPNAYGLYQMHGNVWEWCHDWFGEGYHASSPRCDPPGPTRGISRVCRGGGWSYRSEDCRSAYRGRPNPGVRHFCVGFRVALTAGPAPSGGKRAPGPSRRNKGKGGSSRSRGQP